MAVPPAPTSRLQQPAPWPMVIACLLLLEAVYDIGIRRLPVSDLLLQAPVHALLYSAVLWMVMSLDLARLTILYLALPYPIFFIGWLNPPTAIVCTLVFLFCLRRTEEHTPSMPSEAITVSHLLGFVLILAWLLLSGIGGYGYQSYDYKMHNARFDDLIRYPWPVHYERNPWGGDLNLVYYLAYALPAAMIGKLTSLATAWHVLFAWSLFGVTLVLRWLGVLARTGFAWWLVLLFILFGPLDLFGMASLFIATNRAIEPVSLSDFVHKAWGHDVVEFWAFEHFHGFFGNFLSNTAQLFWSPPQVIPGWMMAALSYFLYIRQHYRSLLFVFSLLSLWAPFPMLALFPVLAVAMTPTLHRGWRQWLTLENTVGAGMLLLVIGSFYLAGSTMKNPSRWMWADLRPASAKLFVISLLYLFGWGAYALARTPALVRVKSRERWWFCGLRVGMFLLGAGVLLLVVGVFHLAGSTMKDPSRWMWATLRPASAKLFVISLFYLFGWGLYALACTPALVRMEGRERWWFCGLLGGMFLLPLRTYGAYNDLMCRGSAPLMFLLLILILRAWQHYRTNNAPGLVALLGALSVCGMVSAISQHSVSLRHYGETQPVERVTAYRYSNECLGPDGTFFETYFRKH